jgi:site-specific recombinase XerD
MLTPSGDCIHLFADKIHNADSKVFLYKITLKKNWSFEEDIPLPKTPKTLPVVLSPEEVMHFFSCVDCNKHRVILTTCYAAGLRTSEQKIILQDQFTDLGMQGLEVDLAGRRSGLAPALKHVRSARKAS